MVLVTSGTPLGSSVHGGPDAGRGGVGLIRARGEIQQLRYGERQEVGEQRRGLRRGLTSGVLLKRMSGTQLTLQHTGPPAGGAGHRGGSQMAGRMAGAGAGRVRATCIPP